MRVFLSLRPLFLGLYIPPSLWFSFSLPVPFPLSFSFISITISISLSIYLAILHLIGHRQPMSRCLTLDLIYKPKASMVIAVNKKWNRCWSPLANAYGRKLHTIVTTCRRVEAVIVDRHTRGCCKLGVVLLGTKCNPSRTRSVTFLNPFLLLLAFHADSGSYVLYVTSV